jgi:hypothetical protein
LIAPSLAGRSELDSNQPQEDVTAKDQQRGNKEAKKPKAEKPKGPGSAYKQSLSKGGQAIGPPAKKT